jgi:hypothetical protein
MPLTPAQLATLKANIAANTATIPAGQPWTGSFAGTQVKDVPNSGDGNAAVAGWYNLPSNPAWIVWRDLPMETVLDTIAFAAMTPVDAVPTTPALTVDVFRARALVCQGKQFNLQNLIIGRTVAAMKKANYRAAMQDCLTGIPAGAAGALIAANWTGVRDAAKFTATNAEKLFSTGTGTSATPADLNGFEGNISADEIQAARNLP